MSGSMLGSMPEMVQRFKSGWNPVPYISIDWWVNCVSKNYATIHVYTQLNSTNHPPKKESFNKRKEAIKSLYIPDSLVNSQGVFESCYCFTINLESPNIAPTKNSCILYSNTRRVAIANGTCVSFCNQPKAHFGLPCMGTPWDNRGKCHMDEKRIQCLSNASQHVPIYLQPFTSYSKILVGNCNFFLLLAFNLQRPR